MKRNALNLILTLATALAMPSLKGMSYKAPQPPPLSVHLPFPQLTLIPNSTCTGNRIAVGFEEYTGGFRLLCADAGQVGFWTTPVEANLVGSGDHLLWSWLCPSGTALVGFAQDESGLRQAACSKLIPIFATGDVHTGALVNSGNYPLDPVIIVACPANTFVQKFEAVQNPGGPVTGFVKVCSAVETVTINVHTPNLPGIDLAVRTVGQPAKLEVQDQKFELDLFNLGWAPVIASNVAVEFRYDTLQWEVLVPSGMNCTNIASRVIGGHDILSLGKRCTIPGTAIKGLGSEAVMTITLHPVGSGPVIGGSAATPVVSIKVLLVGEPDEGADANPNNDVAAFPSSL